ncbi:MAG: hypothetical protein IT288_08655 [Bdellovibrionales bacterium]|nr:hypothetical protein [Bdellovibrionales bacterium]
MLRRTVCTILMLSLGPSFSAGAAEDLGKILGESSSQELAAVQASRQGMLEAMMGRGLVATAAPFTGAFANSKWPEALREWNKTISGSEFAKSPNGQALLGLVLYANGFEISGIETLFGVEKPGELSPAIMSEWKKLAPGSAKVWKSVKVQWHPEWTKVFGGAAQVRATAQHLRAKTDTAAIEAMITETVPDTAERAWLQWQLANALALKGDVPESAKLLSSLMQYRDNPVSKDLMNLTAARLLYKKGFLDVAAQYYQKVPNNSYYWFEAQEELGWIYLRSGQSENVIAQTNTFMATDFGFLVGPEVYYLRGLAQLYVCDYAEAVKALMIFKEKFKGRAQQLMKAENGAIDLGPVMDVFNQSALRIERISRVVGHLPRKTLRDETIRQLSRSHADLVAEAGSGKKLFNQPQDQWLSEVIAARQAVRTTEIGQRIKFLAKRELQELNDVLTKMQVLEVEIIQRVDSAAKRLAKGESPKSMGTRKGQTGSSAKDALVFKSKSEKELWFDELANYRVDMKLKCASLRGEKDEKAN